MAQSGRRLTARPAESEHPGVEINTFNNYKGLHFYFKEVFLMKSSKREAKERNNDLTKTQEVTYKEELKSAESVAETKEMTNEDYS